MEDIGSWYSVLNILGFFAVITNATMLAFVGSQLGDEDEKGGACPDACLRGACDCPEGSGQAGIAVRIYSQRLWTTAMLIEHGVMFMRIAIMKLSPEVSKLMNSVLKARNCVTKTRSFVSKTRNCVLKLLNFPEPDMDFRGQGQTRLPRQHVSAVKRQRSAEKE